MLASIGNKLIRVGNKVGLYPSCCCDEDDEIICDCFDDIGTFCNFPLAGFATAEHVIWVDISNAQAQCQGAAENPIPLWPFFSTTNPLQLFWNGLNSWSLGFSNPTGFIFYFMLSCGPDGWVLNGGVDLFRLNWSMKINFTNPKRNKNGECSINGITGDGTITWSYIEGNTVDGIFVPTVQCNGVEGVTASISTTPCGGCFCPG